MDVFSIGLDLKKVNEIAEKYAENQQLAITNFIKKAMVISKVYIQNKICDDPSLNDNLASIQNQYLSFILTALNLNNSVGNNKTVKTILQTVATEKYQSIEELSNLAFGSESKFTLSTANDATDHTNDELDDKESSFTTNSNLNKDYQQLSISSGRIINVTLNTPNGNLNINIPVQLVPVILPNEVAREFVALNFKPTFMQRYIQWSTGEITFFKDFVLQLDLIKKRNDALKKDTSNILYEHIKKSQNELGSHYINNLWNLFVGNRANKKNIANSILIYEKQSFLQYANDNGLNWKNPEHRNRFFDKSLSFMLVLIDPIYAKSEYYWSGISAVGEYSSKQLKAAATKNTYDLKDIMAAFSQGTSPRF